MLHVMQVLKSLKLKVKFPVLLEMDNKGTVDLVNNWSVCGQTSTYLPWELKEDGLL